MMQMQSAFGLCQVEWGRRSWDLCVAERLCSVSLERVALWLPVRVFGEVLILSAACQVAALLRRQAGLLRELSPGPLAP